MTKVLFLSLVFLFSSISWAYNDRKCMMSNKNDFMFGGLISTTQFTSSTGECSAFGLNREEKKQFYVHNNADFLQIDIARGAGEYLTGFAHLSGCDFRKLSPILQKNYLRIFPANEINPGKLYQEIEQLIKENNKSGALCSPAA